MADSTLDDFMALNDQLTALVEAGVPLDVGVVDLATGTSQGLPAINAVIARRVNRGERLSDAVSLEPSLPSNYRSMMLAGLRANNFETALDAWTSTGKSIDFSWHTLRSALVYPLVICVIAYLGFVSLCLFFVPQVERLHEELMLIPGTALEILRALRTTLPYWVALLPLALLLMVLWVARSGTKHESSIAWNGRGLRWLPGMSKAISHQHCANFADLLATLLDSGTDMQTSLRIAAGACGDPKLAQSARKLADIVESRSAGSRSVTALAFPPLLRWAVLESSEAFSTPLAIRTTAKVYRHASARATARLQTFAPALSCIVIGGGITLLYGLALFTPVIDMLRKLGS